MARYTRRFRQSRKPLPAIRVSESAVTFDGRTCVLQGAAITGRAERDIERPLRAFIQKYGVAAIPILLERIAGICEDEESDFEGIGGELNVLATDDELPQRQRDKAAAAFDTLRMDAENFSEWATRCHDAAMV